MAQIEPDEFTRLVVSGMVNRARMMHPGAFAAWFCGNLANIAAAIPDDYWEMAMKVEPCETPGCDCYKETEVMMAALNVERDCHRQRLPLPIVE